MTATPPCFLYLCPYTCLCFNSLFPHWRVLKRIWMALRGSTPCQLESPACLPVGRGDTEELIDQCYCVVIVGGTCCKINVAFQLVFVCMHQEILLLFPECRFGFECVQHPQAFIKLAAAASNRTQHAWQHAQTHTYTHYQQSFCIIGRWVWKLDTKNTNRKKDKKQKPHENVQLYLQRRQLVYLFCFLLLLFSKLK